MSRHRNIRNISVEDELADDMYSRSYEDTDSYCISPATEAEYMFRRDKGHTLSSFIGDEKITEEDEEGFYGNHSTDYVKPRLDPLDEAKLQSCMEMLHDVLGETYQESTIIQAAIKNNFDSEKTIDELLNKGSSSVTDRECKISPKQEYSKNDSTLIYKANTKNDSTPYKRSPKPNNKNHKESTEKRNSNENKNSASGRSTPILGSSKSQSNETLNDNSLVHSNVNTPNSNYNSNNNFVKTPKSSKSKESIDVKAEIKKRSDGKELLNLVVIGHVDAGKSTLMGHLLYNLGNVSKKVMHKNEVDSRKSGKGSFAFAWVLDETEEERTRGITMDVAMTTFETSTKIVTLMDAPGHKDFIPNMIQGTAQADVAILVISSAIGEFEAGFEAGGQTREHAILARSLGVGQLIVAVNKMDAVEWNKERYDAIVIKMKTFLTKHAGFKEADVYYIPCSGMAGENLTELSKESKLQAWYKDKCLVDSIDMFKPPDRPVDKPFRFCVSDVYKGQGSFVVAGKVESGYIQNGDRLMLMPAAETGMVKGLTCREEAVKFAAAGDHVTASVHGVDMTHVSVGSILCDIDVPIKVTSRIQARIVVFNTQIPITKGFMVVFHSQNLSEPATVSKLISLLNKNSGEVIQKRPRCLTKHMNAIIDIKFSRPVCVELYRNNKVLGRFMLRYSGKTIAAGVITEIK